MIDGVKIIFYSETIVSHLINLGVKVLTPLEEETGEIHFPKYAKYQHLRFKISRSNRVEISGSLHKYWKGENYSNFTYTEFRECVTDLCQKLNLTPLQAFLGGFEFGVNVSPVFDPFEFCSRVIAYKNESFSKMRTNRNIEIGFEARKQQYSVKVYNKGKQYLKNENILRFEVRVFRMKFVKDIPVFTLGDLLKPEILNKLGALLNETFDDCIIGDRVKSSELTANERRIYTECMNPREWDEFDSQKRHLRKNQFRQIIETKGVNKWKEPTGRMISDKWNLLIALQPKSIENLTDLSNGQIGEFNRLGKGLIYRTTDLPPKRFCKSCGREISNQQPKSVFCSARLVGEQQAHRCRNKDSNPRNYLKARENRRYGGLNLFDVREL